MTGKAGRNVDIILPAHLETQGASSAPAVAKTRRVRKPRAKKPSGYREWKPRAGNPATKTQTMTVNDRMYRYGERLGEPAMSRPGPGVEPSIVQTVLNKFQHIPKGACCWMQKLFDPVDQPTGVKDIDKPPDGAVDDSAIGETRHAVYLKPPGQSGKTIPLDGENWSFLLWSPPTLRTACFIIASTEGNDISSDAMNLAAAAWNNLSSYKVALNPKWVQVDETGDIFLQIIQYPTLAKLSPPVNGVSPEFQAYRFAWDGFKIEWNAPALLDQGGEMAVQLPPNIQSRNNHNVLNNLGEDLVDGSYGLDGANQQFFLTTPWGRVTLSTAAVNSSTIVVADPSYMSFATGDVPVVLASGDVLRLNFVSSIPQALNLQWAMAATPTVFTTVRSVTNPLQAVNSEFPLYFTVASLTADQLSQQINVIGIPAFENSGQMFQASPEAVQNIGHFDGGFKVGKKIWQPDTALRLADGQQYAKLRIATSSMSLEQQSTVEIGNNPYADSYDLNFGNAFVQLTGISKSNYPMITMRRGVEAVISPESVFAMFMTKGQPLCEAALTTTSVVNHDTTHAQPAPMFIGSFVSSLVGKINQLPIGKLVTGIVGGVVEGVFGKAREEEAETETDYQYHMNRRRRGGRPRDRRVSRRNRRR